MNRLAVSGCWIVCVLGLGIVSVPAAAPKRPAEKQTPQPDPIEWIDDYAEARQQAWSSRKNLFIYFHAPKQDAVRTKFETLALAENILAPHRDQYIWARLPTDAQITVDGKPQRLLQHPAFAEMHGAAGVAVVDYSHTKAGYYGQVVSTFPFPAGTYYGPRHLSVILGLPPGTLTQRTLVYAVRVHPEAPASAWSSFSPNLAREAENHSHHQASIGVQGHHNWDSRFQNINTQLPGGLIAQEVVAESWPGQDMLSAAHECVNSWRQSDGHWDAVRTRHGLFGYDLKRGHNGIWYGTGLFGRFR